MPYPPTFTAGDSILPKLNDWLVGIPTWLDNINAGSFSLSNLRNLTFRQNTTPAAPAAGDLTLFMDSVDGKLKYKKSNGSVVTLEGVLPNPTEETPAGVMDGVNATFTLSISPAFLLLFWNALLMRDGVGYTRSGAIITMQTGYIPQSGDQLRGVIW